MDRRWADSAMDEAFADLGQASAGMLGRAMARAKSLTKPDEQKLSLSRHDSAKQACSWADAGVEMQPHPSRLTSLFPAADGSPSDPRRAPYPTAATPAANWPSKTPAQPQPPPRVEEEAEQGPATSPQQKSAHGEETGGPFSQFWFYVDGLGKLKGPRTPEEMKALYTKGVVGLETRVRWLPKCEETPALAEQNVDDTSPLIGLCSNQEPPFMSPAVEPAKPTMRDV